MSLAEVEAIAGRVKRTLCKRAETTEQVRLSFLGHTRLLTRVQWHPVAIHPALPEVRAVIVSACTECAVGCAHL